MKRVPYKDVQIVWVNDFYDWPLSGVGLHNGRVVRFKREDIDDEVFVLTALTRRQRLKEWYRRTLFGICVGWHWHYKDGKRAYRFGRSPQWFWGALTNLYYKRAPFRYPFFQWKW
jgi:hypothetical protein